MQLSVPELDDAVGVPGELQVVGHEHDREPLPVELLEGDEDLHGRALVGLLSVLPEALALQAREAAEIPAEAEMPAAAALAVAGVVLEIGAWIARA